jgi:hypothetical protein
VRLVRLERQQSRVADDIRAALASLGRGNTVIGGIALVGVGTVTERPIEAVVLLPHGVIIVIGVDLPDPALRLEAPLGAEWKADGWPLIADDDAVNPATEALDVSQACERRIASLVPGTGPVGTIVAVGPYVETVDQPASDLAGPVRVLHPTPTTMLAATVSLATAHRPRSVDQVRALIRGLAPEAPEFSDEVLIGEGFSRFTDDAPPESLWDSGTAVPSQTGTAVAASAAAATGSTVRTGAATASAAGAAAAGAAAATGSAVGTGWQSKTPVPAEPEPAPAAEDSKPAEPASAAAGDSESAAGFSEGPESAEAAAGSAEDREPAEATAGFTENSEPAEPTAAPAEDSVAAGHGEPEPAEATAAPAEDPERAEPAAGPAEDSKPAEPAAGFTEDPVPAEATAALAENPVPAKSAAALAEDSVPAETAAGSTGDPAPANATAGFTEDPGPAKATAVPSADPVAAGHEDPEPAEADPAGFSPHSGGEAPDSERTEVLPAPAREDLPLFPGATAPPRFPGARPAEDSSLPDDTERTENLSSPTAPGRAEPSQSATPGPTQQSPQPERSAPQAVTLGQITLPPEPHPFPTPRPAPREAASTSKTVRWLPLAAIGLLVALVVAAIAVATSGDDTAAAPTGPPTPATQPPRASTAAPQSLQFALRTADRDQRCASHAFGDAQASLQRTSCSGVRRASYAATVDGRAAAVTVGIVEFPDAALAAAFKAITDTPGGGGILDLASETGKWGATPPPRFENAAYTSQVEGTSVRVVQAVWAPGPSTPDDPGLARAAKAALDLPAQ